MTAIERTAYPRFKPSDYHTQELEVFKPSLEEINFMAQQDIRTDIMRLNFMVQFKTFQALHYFIHVGHVPEPIVATIAKALGLPQTLTPTYNHDRAKLRHRNLIRHYLAIKNDATSRDKLISTTALEAAQTQNDPADIINTILNTLVNQHYELPAFSSLDRNVRNIRQQINHAIFKQVTERLRNAQKLELLTSTLTLNNTTNKTPFNQFKFLPEKVTVTHFKERSEFHRMNGTWYYVNGEQYGDRPKRAGKGYAK